MWVGQSLIDDPFMDEEPAVASVAGISRIAAHQDDALPANRALSVPGEADVLAVSEAGRSRASLAVHRDIPSQLYSTVSSAREWTEGSMMAS